jgi:hypothetical protein
MEKGTIIISLFYAGSLRSSYRGSGSYPDYRNNSPGHPNSGSPITIEIKINIIFTYNNSMYIFNSVQALTLLSDFHAKAPVLLNHY